MNVLGFEHAPGTDAQQAMLTKAEARFNTENLESIEVMLFDNFPDFREIDVQCILDSGQSAQKLTPSTSTIKIR